MKENQNTEDKYFLRIPRMLTEHGYYSEVDYISTINGEFYGCYITPCCHKNDRNIYFSKIPTNKIGKLSAVLFGDKEELENWKHFVFNCKLPTFINIALVSKQENCSQPFVPWLTDKQYTDEEIYNLLGITEEEQKFIDNTLKKFERYSPWFKRYMCGIEK